MERVTFTTLAICLALGCASDLHEDPRPWTGTFDTGLVDDSEPSTSNTTDNGSSGSNAPDMESADVPSTPYCEGVSDWPDEWSLWEEEVVELVNERRAAGANCGVYGNYQPTGPLEMQAELRCAARVHSKDMNERNFFSHTNPDNEGPEHRIADAGYGSSWVGENIAQGYNSPRSVVEGWMDSDGHCSNIMYDAYTEIGVGYYQGAYWTQTFGSM